MSSYTITITPDDTTRASTTLRVDVSDTTARITELLVRAGAAAGLSPQQLPAVDLDLLLRAITPSGPASVPASSAQALPVAPADEAPARAARRATRRATAAAPRRRRNAAEQSEPKATKRAGKRAGRAAAEQPAKSTRAAKSGGQADRAGRGERAYRRAPEDLVEVFGQVGGVTAVARHYGVPRYTAQSWVRRLRNEGQLPASR